MPVFSLTKCNSPHSVKKIQSKNCTTYSLTKIASILWSPVTLLKVYAFTAPTDTLSIKHLRDTVPRKWDNLESPPFPIGNLYRTKRMDDPIHRGAHMYCVTFQNKGCRGSFVTCHRYGTRSIGPRAVATPGLKYRIRVWGCMNGYHCTFLKVRTLGVAPYLALSTSSFCDGLGYTEGEASVCPLWGSWCLSWSGCWFLIEHPPFFARFPDPGPGCSLSE